MPNRIVTMGISTDLHGCAVTLGQLIHEPVIDIAIFYFSESLNPSHKKTAGAPIRAPAIR